MIFGTDPKLKKKIKNNEMHSDCLQIFFAEDFVLWGNFACCF